MAKHYGSRAARWPRPPERAAPGHGAHAVPDSRCVCAAPRRLSIGKKFSFALPRLSETVLEIQAPSLERAPSERLLSCGSPAAAGTARDGSTDRVAVDAAGVSRAGGTERDLIPAQPAVGNGYGTERARDHLKFLRQLEVALPDFPRAAHLGRDD